MVMQTAGAGAAVGLVELPQPAPTRAAATKSSVRARYDAASRGPGDQQPRTRRAAAAELGA